MPTAFLKTLPAPLLSVGVLPMNWKTLRVWTVDKIFLLRTKSASVDPAMAITNIVQKGSADSRPFCKNN